MKSVFETPNYPLPTPTEPCHLFCNNYLLYRETGYNEYQFPYGGQTPLEYLIRTIHQQKLHRLERGTPIQPGDLILIRHNHFLYHSDTLHSMIAIKKDVWYGADNARFFSRAYSMSGTDMFKERDAISMILLRLNTQDYTFGRYCFEIWRK